MGQFSEFEWTDEQKEFLDLNKNGRFVVKACPGSGKTTAVSERVYRFIQNWREKKSGIAVLSFTNVAADEIKENCKKEHDLEIRYPHFIGTLDSFINNYIFLPYGHLVMDFDEKIMMVGEPFNHWPYYDYPNKHFTRITFGLDGSLVYPKGWKHNIKIDNMKYYFAKKGYVTQKDIIYYSMRVLEEYPKIAKALSLRFPYIIIDEAQDTTDVHMRIFDLLIENGLKNIILVGDPEQSLYEWNGAKPRLFNDKFNEWEDESIIFKDNFRSSQKICDFFSKLSDTNQITSKCFHNVNIEPVIISHMNNYDDVIEIFKDACVKNGIEITENNVSVLFRGNAEVNARKKSIKQSDIPNLFEDSQNKNFSINIIEGLYDWFNKNFFEGFQKIEKEFIKLKYNLLTITKKDIHDEIEKVGFYNHRKNIYSFIKEFPPITNNQSIDSWINKVNNCTDKFQLCEVTNGLLKNTNYFAKDITFEYLFNDINSNDVPDYNVGTVHSVKGCSFDAILLILKNRTDLGYFYQDIVINEINLNDDEELRIVYVALSRPKKLLYLAVPQNDYNMWKSIFS